MVIISVIFDCFGITALMDIWNRLIIDGDRYAIRCQFEQAKEKYIKAVERTRFLYSNLSDKKVAVQAIAKSHNQLIETLLSNAEYEFAGNVALQAHRIISNIQSNTPNKAGISSYLEETVQLQKTKIYELLSYYPEISICSDCHLNIFGNIPESNEANLYTIN